MIKILQLDSRLTNISSNTQHFTSTIINKPEFHAVSTHSKSIIILYYLYMRQSQILVDKYSLFDLFRAEIQVAVANPLDLKPVFVVVVSTTTKFYLH